MVCSAEREDRRIGLLWQSLLNGGLRVAWSLGGVLLCSGILAGCAVHYFDTETGAEHIWGFGHMVMKATAPDEGIRTIVQGTEVLGVAASRVGGQYSLTLGWARRHLLEVVDEHSSVRLEWPSSSFLRVRVGSEWPRLQEPPPVTGNGARP